MRRVAGGISSDVGRAGPADRPRSVKADPRPMIPPAILYDRALAWHRRHMGIACECTDANRYPCEECRREVLELEALLDGVVRDTIRVVMGALERMT